MLEFEDTTAQHFITRRVQKHKRTQGSRDHGRSRPRNQRWIDFLRSTTRNSTQNSRSTFESRGRFTERGEDGELLAKSDILESQLATSLEGRDESANKRRNHAGMVPADRRLIKFGARG